MLKWQSRRIGDFIHRVKDPVTVEEQVEYKQVTIRMNYKGVVLRGFKKGCDIKTKNQWRVRSGLFILSRIDARNGAFGIIPEELEGAIVSNDFLAYEIDQTEVDIEFFNSFLQSSIFLDACIKASRGNTNRKRVNEDFFLDYKVEIPTLSEQQRLITRINKAKDCIGIVNKEIIHQETLLTKLKQTILQEAIQGKLTTDWKKGNPDVELASQLLERIQKEKQHLIAEKKIRKEKLLPPITPEEIPFEIPDSWEWCRFAEIGILSPRNTESDSRDSSFVPMALIFSEYGKSCQHKIRKWKEINRGYTHFRDGDVGLAKITPCFENQKSTVFRNLTGGFGAGTTELHIIRPIKIYADYILIFLKSPHYIETGIPKMTGTAGQKRVPKEYFSNKPFPLPPLAEQAAIVKRVESLMDFCRQLETKIKHSRTHAENLLQAVLKEAFTSA